MNKPGEEEKGVYPNGTAMFKTDTNPKALGFGEEEKEISKELTMDLETEKTKGKELLDKDSKAQIMLKLINYKLSRCGSESVFEEIEAALASQLKEVLGVIESKIIKRKPTHGSCCTCQVCGGDKDCCWCEENKIYENLKAEVERLGEK